MKREAKVTSNDEIKEVVWEWFKKHAHIQSNGPK
jgi:hypothetical protein